MMAAVALASFAAGAGLGLALPVAVRSGPTPDELSPDQRWMVADIERSVATFGLSAQQVRDLRTILLAHLQEKARILESADEWPPQLFAQLEGSRRRMEERRKFILDERQRRLFDELDIGKTDPGRAASGTAHK